MGYLSKPIWEHSSPYCSHQGGCIQSMFKQSIKVLSKSYAIRLCIGLLITLLKQKSISINQLISLLLNKDYLKFSIFIALQPILIRSIVCSSRTILLADHPSIYLISGFITGYISLPLIKKNSRLLSYYMLSRAINSLYIRCKQKHNINNIPYNYDYVLFFMLILGWIGYGFMGEPDLMGPSLEKYIERFIENNGQNYKLRYTLNEYIKQHLEAQNINSLFY